MATDTMSFDTSIDADNNNLKILVITTNDSGEIVSGNITQTKLKEWLQSQIVNAESVIADAKTLSDNVPLAIQAAEDASASKEAAATSESNSSTSENNAKISEENASALYTATKQQIEDGNVLSNVNDDLYSMGISLVGSRPQIKYTKVTIGEDNE